MPAQAPTSHDPVTVSDPPDVPVLVYDGDCGFCRRSADRLSKWVRNRVVIRASQELSGDFAEIPAEDFDEAVQFIDTDGRTASAAKAIFETLRYSLLRGLPLALYRKRAFATVSELIYRWVARNRSHLSRIGWFFLGQHRGPSQYRLSRWIFVRGVALIYAIAFLSLWGQIEGLVGSSGILPAANIAEQLSHHSTFEALKRWPSLFLLNPTDAMLHILCGTGAFLSMMLAFTGFLPGVTLLVLWALYLSLAHVGQIFLGYQWDILLLETGFLAMFLAPFHARLTRTGGRAPSRIALFTMHWLLFRLMFRSGLVKLASNDDVWWDLTALGHHYWTQPLPTGLAWYMHQLPMGFQKSSVAIVFAIELIVPILFFAPRRLRRFGALATIVLMVLIHGTGNYTFFNLLTIVLCIPLLDDHFWPRAWRGTPDYVARKRGQWMQTVWRGSGQLALLAIAVTWLIMTAPPTWHTAQQTYVVWQTRKANALSPEERKRALQAIQAPTPIPELTQNLMRRVSLYRLVGQYGLFANMTESRPEIIIEGSRDGRKWHAYEFRWKPDQRRLRPRIVAPHQPRLDWQMWFAALRNPRHVSWFPPFLKALLENRPDVTALLEHNPFPESPPRYVRARLYNYEFSDRKTRALGGGWWTAQDQGYYIPIPAISLNNFNATDR